MNYYEKSLKELKKRIKEDYTLTQKEWDIYAKNYALYSAITLCAHLEVESWEALKYELGEPEKRVYKKIKQIRKKLHKTIDIYGLQAEETKQINESIQKLINEYYRIITKRELRTAKLYPKENLLYTWYEESYQRLQQITKEQLKFPSVGEWNQYAQKYHYTSSQVLEYISGWNWNEIRKKMINEK